MKQRSWNTTPRNGRLRYLALFAIGLGLPGPFARGATFEVNSIIDQDDGVLVGGVSLRDAINEANLTPGPDTIRFNVAGTIVLLSDLPAITTSMDIENDASAPVVIDGNGQFRAFVIQNPSGEISIRGLSIANCLTFPGDVSGAESGIATGAAILLLDGRLVVEATSFYGNTASGGSGGAIFAAGGRLELIDCTFERNAAIAGLPESGTPTIEQGKAGAIYVHTDATAFGAALNFGDGVHANWATHDAGAIGDDDDIFGTVRALPVVLSILRLGVSRTRLDEVTYVVAFSEPVSGVDATDFETLGIGVSNASVQSVTNVGAGDTYVVTLATGEGSGTLGLKIQDDDSIRNASSLPLGGTGTRNGDFAADDLFTLDRERPVVQSIQGLSHDPSQADALTFIVTFSEDIAGFDDPGDVFVAHTGTIHETISIKEIDDRRHKVTLTGVTGEGEVSVFVKSNAATDFVGNPNLISSESTPVRFDDVGPRLIAAELQSHSTHDDTVILGCRFHESVADLDASNVTISPASASISGFEKLGVDTYLAEIRVPDGVSRVVMTFDPNSVFDAFGNANRHSYSQSIRIPITSPAPLPSPSEMPAATEPPAPEPIPIAGCGTAFSMLMGALAALICSQQVRSRQRRIARRDRPVPTTSSINRRPDCPVMRRE